MIYPPPIFRSFFSFVAIFHFLFILTLDEFVTIKTWLRTGEERGEYICRRLLWKVRWWLTVYYTKLIFFFFFTICRVVCRVIDKVTRKLWVIWQGGGEITDNFHVKIGFLSDGHFCRKITGNLWFLLACVTWKLEKSVVISAWKYDSHISWRSFLR